MNIINCSDYLNDEIGTLFSTEIDVNYKRKASVRDGMSSVPPPDIIVKTKNLGQSLITLKKLLT